jgi:hypothetical protein
MSSPKNTIENRPNVMDELNVRAKAIGVSMYRVCRETKLDSSIIHRWRAKEPKSIHMLRVMNDYLKGLEDSKK